MKVENILYADIFRDGGSYGFAFNADDGQQYEFFLQTTAFSAAQDTTHHAPVIYLDDSNTGHVVRSLSWDEAKKFVGPLNFSDRRFDELVSIVANEGKRFFN
ncbi:hypothetical protein IGS59_11665 [Janthinobacterium sp. GW460P]|uniref:hypothetical protein n=1 Tax=unclassified Janthinobacterium TaxID=2610881 RepID=UPI000A31E5B7|nr:MULTISPECIES: hypothetical protein [unclassified Janthinobacterium]MCC7702903.1 hypothetical protein [Janthinobacterium sp. GW460P]MCC7708411.1 hypothetical protein [Janthinobacterium sp. GW460W]